MMQKAKFICIFTK